MTSDISNDNNAAPAGGRHAPDAHGQAAILLVESLIHILVARSVIGLADAIEIVDTAAEVKEETAAYLGDSATSLQQSMALLAEISRSLKGDLPR